MRAWDEERAFRPLVEADAQITALLDPAALEAVFDLPSTVRQVDTVFERLKELAAREDPIHV